MVIQSQVRRARAFALIVASVALTSGCFDEIEPDSCVGVECQEQPNNAPANNGATNNGAANNGPANNGPANNGPGNNGPGNNGPANNGGPCDGACADGDVWDPACPDRCPCGDYKCEGDETAQTCRDDCTVCGPEGDARCEIGEKPDTCADCAFDRLGPPGPALMLFNGLGYDVDFRLGGSTLRLAPGSSGWPISVQPDRHLPVEITDPVAEETVDLGALRLRHDNILLAYEADGAQLAGVHIGDLLVANDDSAFLKVVNALPTAVVYSVGDDAGELAAGTAGQWVAARPGFLPHLNYTAMTMPHEATGPELAAGTAWMAFVYMDIANARPAVAFVPYRKSR